MWPNGVVFLQPLVDDRFWPDSEVRRWVDEVFCSPKECQFQGFLETYDPVDTNSSIWVYTLSGLEPRME